MNNEGTLLKRLIALLAIAVLLVIVGVYVFRAEIVEGTGDAFAKNQFADKHVLADADLALLKGFTLRPEHNDAAFIHVSNIRPGETSSIGTSILFLLSNDGYSNDFPSIKVILLNRQGVQTRELTYSAKDYEHADHFEKQDINLLVNLRENESSFTVKPYYPAQL